MRQIEADLRIMRNEEDLGMHHIERLIMKHICDIFEAELFLIGSKEILLYQYRGKLGL